MSHSTIQPPTIPSTVKGNQHSLPVVDLPAPLLELQVSILEQIPPNQLFVFQRVSDSWNIMLQNQYLLEATNASLAFLTSAHDLTSHMKHRTRIVRGNPV